MTTIDTRGAESTRTDVCECGCALPTDSQGVPVALAEPCACNCGTMATEDTGSEPESGRASTCTCGSHSTT